MEITSENGYLKYHIEEGELIIDDIKSFSPKKGTGKKMINQLKDTARDLQLPISLASYPQDDTINKENLNAFYFACGFENSEGDIFIWKP